MWYFELNGTQQGPETTEQVQQRLSNGELSSASLVWREGMSDWMPLAQVPELQTLSAPQPAAASTYGAPQHAQGPPGVAMPPTQNGLALTSMILGICSVVLTFGCGLGFLLAIPAVITGHISRKQIRTGSHMQTGEGMALAGLIIGYIVIGLTALMGIFIAVAVISEGSSGSSTFP